MSRLVSSPQAVLGFAASHSFREKTEPARSASGGMKGSCQRFGEALSVAPGPARGPHQYRTVGHLLGFLCNWNPLSRPHRASRRATRSRTRSQDGTNLSILRKGECAVKTLTVLLIIEDSFDLVLYATSLRDKGYTNRSII